MGYWHMRGAKKGQITFSNLLMIFAAIIVFAIALLPILNETIANATSGYDPTNPNENLIIIAAQLLPFFLFAGLGLTAINYAIPRREGVGYG